MLLKAVFDIENNRIHNAKKERIDKQYYIDFTVTRAEVSDLIKTAEEFNAHLLDFTEKVGQERVVEYRQKAAKLLNE